MRSPGIHGEVDVLQHMELAVPFVTPANRSSAPRPLPVHAFPDGRGYLGGCSGHGLSPDQRFYGPVWSLRLENML